ncbi:hypothetical protein BEQ56_03725 [Anaerolineaceae bacterium oral taxon 439]|nr:hypothetical protein BEQ56_03725 [Anaerolineaceae bacterium oral taxon 439]
MIRWFSRLGFKNPCVAICCQRGGFRLNHGRRGLRRLERFSRRRAFAWVMEKMVLVDGSSKNKYSYYKQG